MKKFANGQRVRFSDGELKGKTGRVVRLRMADNGAWLAMDEDIPDKLRSFPADDASGRGNHVKAYPEECEAV